MSDREDDIPYMKPSLANAFSPVAAGCTPATEGLVPGQVAAMDRVLAAKRVEHGGPDAAHPDIARALHGVGNAYDSEDNFPKARVYYEQALAMNYELYGKAAAHRDIAACLYTMGNICLSEHNLAKARGYYQESLEMRKEVNDGEGAARLDVASSYYALGNTYKSEGKSAKARESYARSLEIRQDVHCADGVARTARDDAIHPDVAKSLHGVGAVCYGEGDLAGAEAYFERAWDVQVEAGNEANAMAQTMWEDLQGVKKQKGTSAGRRKMESYAAGPLAAAAGSVSPGGGGNGPGGARVKTETEKLGEACYEAGDYTLAREHYEEALETLMEQWGQGGGAAAQQQDDEDDAQQRRRQALQNIANAMSRLGAVCVSEGDLRGAEDYFEQALEAQFGVTPSKNHPNAQTMLGSLKGVRSMIDSPSGQKKMERYAKLQRMRKKREEGKAAAAAATAAESAAAASAAQQSMLEEEKRAEQAMLELLMEEGGDGGGGGRGVLGAAAAGKGGRGGGGGKGGSGEGGAAGSSSSNKGAKKKSKKKKKKR